VQRFAIREEMLSSLAMQNSISKKVKLHIAYKCRTGSPSGGHFRVGNTPIFTKRYPLWTADSTL